MCHPADSFTKPDVADVEQLLRQYDALLIHFSGPEGDELRSERQFPNDLLNAIDNPKMELSCCVVRATDHFDTHSWGCIGLVLRLKNDKSLIAADRHDCGSREEKDDKGDIRRMVDPRHLKDLSLGDLEVTITERTGHNEWVVKDYNVLGIFVHPPGTAGDRRYRPSEVRELFPGQRIFGFQKGSIIECNSGVQ